MKKISLLFLASALIVCAACAFIFYPFMCTDLHLKIYFTEDSAFTDCSLYYTTTDTPNMSRDTKISAETSNNMADLVLPAELCDKLTGLRLDFTEADNLICIHRIELCSGGFVRKTFDASQFFAEDKITVINDISSLQCSDIITYIGTSGKDPYIMFHSEIIQGLNDTFSHYTGTKIFICLFIVAVILLSRKKYFTAD